MQPCRTPPLRVGLSEGCLELNECERQAHNSTIMDFESWVHDATNMLDDEYLLLFSEPLSGLWLMATILAKHWIWK